MKAAKSTPRKLFVKAAVAGLLVAIPLAAVSVPATAEVPLTEPGAADIARPGHHGVWDDDYSSDRWNRWDNRRHNNDRDRDRDGWRNAVPRGAFGSS